MKNINTFFQTTKYSVLCVSQSPSDHPASEDDHSEIETLKDENKVLRCLRKLFVFQTAPKDPLL